MYGTGAKISSMSGALSSARVRTNAAASPTHEVSMPLRNTKYLSRLLGDSAATSVIGAKLAMGS